MSEQESTTEAATETVIPDPVRRSAKKHSIRHRSAEIEDVSESNEKRHDPRPRRVDALGVGPTLTGKEPDRHYLCCSPASEDVGVPYFTALGYRVEKYRSRGRLRIVNARKPKEGEDITWKSEVLMSCPMEDYELRMKEGDGISGGSDLHDARMKAIYAPEFSASSDRSAEPVSSVLASEIRHRRGTGPKYFTYSRTLRNG